MQPPGPVRLDELTKLPLFRGTFTDLSADKDQEKSLTVAHQQGARLTWASLSAVFRSPASGFRQGHDRISMTQDVYMPQQTTGVAAVPR